MAPPTIAVQIIPDACPVNLPKPFVPKEKIVGNIMELNKPIHNKHHMATFPPNKIANKINTTTTDALNAKHLLGSNLFSTAVPTKRPTMAPPQ